MSRGGRGGRGRGTNKSFSREQLTSLGVGNNEVLPGPVTQPPPLFPLLDHKPIGLTITNEMKYQLELKQDFIDNLKESPSYVKLSNKEPTTVKCGDYQIEKLLAQMPNVKNNFNWALFPSELRPKLVARKLKKPPVKKIKTENDIEARLATLEKMETTTPLSTAIKEENEEPEEEDLLNEDEEDEEMDDGTDYANNYFDNGEGYDDEDDNLDDGPIY